MLHERRLGGPLGCEFQQILALRRCIHEVQCPGFHRRERNTHALMAQFGRAPREVVIMPGLSPVLGSTEAEAARREEDLADLVHPAVGVWMLSENLDFPLHDQDPDELLPVAEIRQARQPTASVETNLKNAQANNLTIARAARIIARSRSQTAWWARQSSWRIRCRHGWRAAPATAST